jgi:hypothetical protein
MFGRDSTERTMDPVDELTIIMLGWAPPAMISDPFEGDMHIELRAWAPSLTVTSGEGGRSARCAGRRRLT